MAIRERESGGSGGVGLICGGAGIRGTHDLSHERSVQSNIFIWHVMVDDFVLALLANRSHSGSGECMTVEELECEDDSLSSINWVLNLARAVFGKPKVLEEEKKKDPAAGPIDQVQVCVRKVRNNVARTIGDAFLSYNRVTGEFLDIDEPSGKT
ncbi:twinkle like protein [Quercus suber]|uniref:Twinkle like protein n=1 Tax=Quercus suber TaxID=58331 RepID=A0AAW0K294_QUESU